MLAARHDDDPDVTAMGEQARAEIEERHRIEQAKVDAVEVIAQPDVRSRSARMTASVLRDYDVEGAI